MDVWDDILLVTVYIEIAQLKIPIDFVTREPRQGIVVGVHADASRVEADALAGDEKVVKDSVPITGREHQQCVPVPFVECRTPSGDLCAVLFASDAHNRFCISPRRHFKRLLLLQIMPVTGCYPRHALCARGNSHG